MRLFDTIEKIKNLKGSDSKRFDNSKWIPRVKTARLDLRIRQESSPLRVKFEKPQNFNKNS